jgi:methylated-DNA-protein-cysteine methyltransferase related protein
MGHIGDLWGRSMQGTSFYQRVYEVVARVPRGRVVTYGQIARALGLPQGARAVGWALRQCPAELPWQRVVNAQGGLSKGDHPEHIPLQRALLEEEGVSFDLEGRVDLTVYGWDGI